MESLNSSEPVDQSWCMGCHDRSDTCWVAVDTAGVVQDVQISSEWLERLRVTDLGPAMFEAYTGAVAAAIMAATSRRQAARKAPANGPHETESNAAELAGGAWLEGDRGAWRKSVRRWLDGVDAELERLEQRKTTQLAEAQLEHVVSGPHGYVELLLRGRHITAVTFHQRRASAAAASRMAADTLAAFTAAQARTTDDRKEVSW